MNKTELLTIVAAILKSREYGNDVAVREAQDLLQAVEKAESEGCGPVSTDNSSYPEGKPFKLTHVQYFSLDDLKQKDLARKAEEARKKRVKALEKRVPEILATIEENAEAIPNDLEGNPKAEWLPVELSTLNSEWVEDVDRYTGEKIGYWVFNEKNETDSGDLSEDNTAPPEVRFSNQTKVFQPHPELGVLLRKELCDLLMKDDLTTDDLKAVDILRQKIDGLKGSENE